MGDANKRGNYYERRENAINRDIAINKNLDEKYGPLPEDAIKQAKVHRKELARLMAVKINERNIKFIP